MQKKKIAVLVGSLRRDSYNRKIARQLIRLSPENLEMEIVEIGHLPHYNEDIDQDQPPKEYVEFRKKIEEADGFLFVTPEYNRTIPGVLKNALDVASRPYGKNVWSGKPGAIVSVSMSALGGFGANLALRQPMMFLNVLLMQNPEAYIGSVHTLFDDKGNLAPDTEKFLKNFIDSFAQWTEKF
ncbi:MAG: NAD(P)H-dependent oxidoreductase [Bacteroidota bacterium]|jgi:chromate reductase|nr:NAD(P)H-dependent oxidoreductase [Bacteroidota bacterium]HHU97069.1 NAD(P)H-dependent oxidoreductase [Petrimonas sp.]